MKDVHGNEVSEEDEGYLDEIDIKVDPFTKSNWKTAESRDLWSDRHSAMVSAKNMAEWRSVMDSETDREAAIIHVNNRNREDWLKIVGEHGFSYRDIRYTEPYDGFSHTHHSTDIDDLERITYAVIAEDDDTADKMKEAELELDSPERHRVIGELLGFPDCCMDFFEDVWLGDGVIDPMYEITENSNNTERLSRNSLLVDDPEPWANVMYRYYGHSFITHLPCSWDCEESIEIGRRRGEIMAQNGYKDTANHMWEWLRLPMTWTGKNRICHIRNRHFIGSSHTSHYWNERKIVWRGEHEDGGEIV